MKANGYKNGDIIFLSYNKTRKNYKKMNFMKFLKS